MAGSSIEINILNDVFIYFNIKWYIIIVKVWGGGGGPLY